jgi:hypothetical protein
MADTHYADKIHREQLAELAKAGVKVEEDLVRRVTVLGKWIFTEPVREAAK